MEHFNVHTKKMIDLTTSFDWDMKILEHCNSSIVDFQQYFIMAIETIKQVIRKSNLAPLTAVILLLLQSCHNKESTYRSNGKLVQEYVTSAEVFTIELKEQGALGSTVTLCIFNLKNKQLIEEVDLRGENYLPKIDSVRGNNVYIHYNFPTDSIETLDFKSVMLGTALINKQKLRYNYYFKNMRP